MLGRSPMKKLVFVFFLITVFFINNTSAQNFECAKEILVNADAKGISLDGEKNIFVTGEFQGSAIFDNFRLYSYG